MPLAADGLASLEIIGERRSGELFRVGLERAFSPGRRTYSLRVDDGAASAYYVVARPRREGAAIRVNGARAYEGIPAPVPLPAGDSSIVVSAEGKPGRVTEYRVDVRRMDLSSEYRVEKLLPGLWRIQDYGGFPSYEDMYLIEGPERALLIDTGMGKGDLAAEVAALTRKPVSIALTHGHHDHTGQLDRFPGSPVYMSEEDRSFLPPGIDEPRFRRIGGGERIDLGDGDAVEAIAVPGHTAGSLVFLHPRTKSVAVGDAIGSGSYVFLFLPGSSPLSLYRDALGSLRRRLEGEGELRFLVGHHWQERVPLVGSAALDLVADMHALAGEVAEGRRVGRLSSVRIGPMGELECRVAELGLAALWYNPDKLGRDSSRPGIGPSSGSLLIG
jgi:glyoxylase-like metal-dependent hydrolase (beta-lactamase superfamily II)